MACVRCVAYVVRSGCVCLRQRRLVVCARILLLEKIMEAWSVCQCGCREEAVESSDWLADLRPLDGLHLARMAGWGKRGQVGFSNMQHELQKIKEQGAITEDLLDTPNND